MAAVTRKITTSQTGDVFEARDSASGLLVALKRVRRLVIRERKALEIERAVRILTTISHPNILPLFGVFADTTSLYLVMDLCQVRIVSA